MDEISAYKENTILTQSSGGLIVKLYEGAIKFLNQTIQEMEAGNIAAKGECIGKATEIINELNCGLDIEAGGETAQNLRDLYLFMVRHLVQANLKRDPEMIREVIKLLEDLNEGWKAIAS